MISADPVLLLKQRSAHHSGCLFELEELALAQLQLERIEVLGRVCPNLKILTLQANCISRLENLSRLKVINEDECEN